MSHYVSVPHVDQTIRCSTNIGTHVTSISQHADVLEPIEMPSEACIGASHTTWYAKVCSPQRGRLHLEAFVVAIVNALESLPDKFA